VEGRVAGLVPLELKYDCPCCPRQNSKRIVGDKSKFSVIDRSDDDPLRIIFVLPHGWESDRVMESFLALPGIVAMMTVRGCFESLAILPVATRLR